MDAPKDFARKLGIHANAVSALLAEILSDRPLKGEIVRPASLMAAMRYGALNGGKRLRPFLLIETAALFGAIGTGPLRAAAALECVHCYSLIHDDLPAMDDDEMRRGKPTVHKAFGEAAAILAGDSLLTLAFEILADRKTHPDAKIRTSLILSLARAAGPGGMAGGQMLDLASEGKRLSRSDIGQMQSMKTGALIRHACEAGAIIGRAGPQERNRMVRFGETLGRAFQLADDILDVTSTPENLGKRAAKDAARGKQTLVALIGVGEGRKLAVSLIEEALGCLARFGAKAALLGQAARFVVDRNH